MNGLGPAFRGFGWEGRLAVLDINVLLFVVRCPRHSKLWATRGFAVEGLRVLSLHPVSFQEVQVSIGTVVMEQGIAQSHLADNS